MYDHRYPTKTCGRSNPTVRSSWDNVSSPSGGRISREGFRRLPTPRRSGARVDGMANSGELLINVVRSNGCDRAGARDYAAFLGFFFLEPS